MTIRRVVPNLPCSDVETTRDFYVGLLGFEVAMDMGWIVTVASPNNPTAQISLSQGEVQPTTDDPSLTVEVGDVDAIHAAAVAAQGPVTSAVSADVTDVTGMS
jgi:catechol 2,3-dioxygenase-like lactoylglutathione lyase family enzyme